MKPRHEQDDMTVRAIPSARFAAIGWMTLVLVVAATAAWEWRMRSLELRAGDLDDGLSHWTVERRKLAAGDHDDVVIFGSSRILFDTDLDVWEEITGRRPIQLALVGSSPRPFLERFAEDADFDGLVVVDVTPEIFFADFATAFPEYLGLNDLWREESPSRRFGHQVGLLLSRRLAFLDDSYNLPKLIEHIEIPDREGIRRPFLEVWKISESFDDRQYRLWPRIETDERLRQHAMQVWMAGRAQARPPPEGALLARINAEIRRDVAKIRARGGDVVFVRPPSAGAYYAREQGKVPRAPTWDRLLRETGTFGIHFEDYPEMQGLDIPEMSHLNAESATRFTRAYVEVLVQQYPWLRTRPASESAP
ncbi:MAG: hypothetical protein ACREVI_11405 [Steroidobacteraceae bacterium]